MPEVGAPPWLEERLARWAEAGLIQGQQVDVESLITARLPLTSTLEALELLLRKQGVKYALIPPAFQQALLPGVAPQ